MLDLTRRKFLIGLGLVGIAPALVQASSIMRVRPVDPVDALPGGVEFVFRTAIPAGKWRLAMSTATLFDAGSVTVSYI